MVAVGDVNRRFQKRDGSEEIVCRNRVLVHDLPFLFRKRAGFMEDAVRCTHFSNVVQQRPAPYIPQGFIIKAQPGRELYGQIRHPLRVAFGLSITQLKRARPALLGRILCQREFDVGMLQIVEYAGVVDGNGCLSCQRVQKIQPLIIC